MILIGNYSYPMLRGPSQLQASDNPPLPLLIHSCQADKVEQRPFLVLLTEKICFKIQQALQLIRRQDVCISGCRKGFFQVWTGQTSTISNFPHKLCYL